ncbi:MAG: ribosome maturation factor RimM [Zoogloea sp.]|nr:ribosome maturation factor RimM [Zoogloea sp.]
MIVLGRIVAPFGVQGWLKIHPFGDDPQSWRKMSNWWLAPDPETPDEGWKAYKLHGCKVHGKGVVASLEGVADRNGAEALDGWYIAAPREALPAAGKDEYYWADLVGMAVENLAGVQLGTVSGLLETGAHDVLQIENGETERLVPFVAKYVQDVDLAARRIKVDWEADW